MSLCKSASKTSLPYISLKALEAAEADPTTVKGAIEEETIDFLPKRESRIGIIPALGTLVLLVGVLGTIDSLWAAFHSIDVLDTAKKQASLAHGISSSLNPTAFGLLVCMLLIFVHYTLRSFALKITEKIHLGVAVLHNLLVPKDIMSFAPMAPAAVAANAAPFEAEEEYVETKQEATKAAKEEVASNDESFDDNAIEDIKDEEEII
jgi:hypothetical protein